MFYAFKVLAKFKFLRGTALDLFGYTAERETERALISQYQQLIQNELEVLKPETLGRALEIARVPEHIRGYGHVKQAAIESAYAEWTRITSESPVSAKLMNSFRKFA
jgi:indolepyruvate ferredoxin oxidoreductase